MGSVISQPTIEQLLKLPQWVQTHIQKLQRERETAVRALNEYCDNQTPAAFWVDDAECTGEERGPSFKRRYFQGDRINVSHAGIEASIYLSRKDDGQRIFGIEIKFEPSKPETSFEKVAMIPFGHCCVNLVSKDNL